MFKISAPPSDERSHCGRQKGDAGDHKAGGKPSVQLPGQKDGGRAIRTAYYRDGRPVLPDFQFYPDNRQNDARDPCNHSKRFFHPLPPFPFAAGLSCENIQRPN